jgi:DNA repair exonuclease SbcCD ATPase subunit
MRIERLLLQRFCQHTNRTIDFSPGLNVILGPIGSGKSNILKGIRLAFTNSSGNAGVREADIQYGSESSAHSGIYLVGSHADKRFFLTRNINPSSREFYWEGSTVKLRAEKAINDEIFEKMGIDTGLFDEFIAVPQGELAGILDMTDGDRSEIMQKLVGLQKYAKLYTWLGSYLTKNPVITNYENPEDVQARLDALMKQKAQYQIDLDALIPPTQVEVDVAKETVANYALAKDTQQRLLSAQAALEDNRRQYPLAEEAKKSIDASKVVHEESLRVKRAEHALLAEQQLQAARYDTMLQLRHRLQVLQSQITFSAFPPAGYSTDVPGLEVQLQKASGELAILKRFKDLVDGGHKACPTCLRAVTADFSEVVKEIPAEEKKCKDLYSIISLSKAYDVEVARLNAQREVAKQELPGVELRLRELGEIPVPPQSSGILAEATNKASYAVNVALAKANEVTASAAAAEVYVTNLEAAIVKWQAEVEVLTAKSAGVLAISQAKYDEAKHTLAVLEAVQSSQASLRGAISVIDKQIPVIQEQLVKSIADKARAEKAIQIRSGIEIARDLVHRDKLPFELSKNGMLAMAANMNDVLEAFSSQYRISAGAGSSFQATFFSDAKKGKQSDTRLSGGEKAQFGLALIIASHTNWAQELGFLALDEPTYGFGQGDMRCVSIAIEHLRKLSSDQGLQVIVVTHEKSIVPLFDHVITLEG